MKNQFLKIVVYDLAHKLLNDAKFVNLINNTKNKSVDTVEKLSNALYCNLSILMNSNIECYYRAFDNGSGTAADIYCFKKLRGYEIYIYLRRSVLQDIVQPAVIMGFPRSSNRVFLIGNGGDMNHTTLLYKFFNSL